MEGAPPGQRPGGAPLDPTALKSSGTSGELRAKVRFTPGTMLGDRYRVVALLGKGGMGEVYRAEDTRLGQQVALKFLPSEFASDPQKLQRLYDEVRLGRQVSHPNVCRLYDVAEIEGHHFIAMEYIDGEDLASLLRRIGKLPHEKALDLARDICAGLAAAHGLEIIHRDLKPANVMIDGRGDARITDFGLAALAEDLEARREIAGTPAYMAPEQLSGGDVSQKTDLYALGLILYEMFTGKRLFAGDTFGEVVSQHSTASSQSISRETATLDPAVQRIIVRCLEPEPAKRPASIHSVIAALPGGDPLQAAIDAGETPSPEMLAAAGSSGELRPAIAWPLLIATLLVILSAAALAPRASLYGRTTLPHDGSELATRAREILKSAGSTQKPADTAWEFGLDSTYRSWKRERVKVTPATDQNLETIFTPLVFAYRESPAEMLLAPGWRVSGGSRNPALDIGGMSQVILESDGRLRRMTLVPPEESRGHPAETETDWTNLLEAAGVSSAALRPTDPRWRAPVGSDRRVAWLATVEGLRDPVRIEAASLEGRPVWLEVFPPWRGLRESFAIQRPSDRFFGALMLFLLVSTLIGGAILAVRNTRRGRGDRQGAWKLGALTGASQLLGHATMTDHFHHPGREANVIIALLAYAVFWGGLIWIWYLALEPYLRRRWPRALISWSRALQRRWLDPLVGRDLLIGVLAGASLSLLIFISLAVPEQLGWEPPVPSGRALFELSAWKFTLGSAFQLPGMAVQWALGWMVVLLLAHLFVRRRSLAVAVLAALLAATGFLLPENYPLLDWTMRVVMSAAIVFTIMRFGLLALASLVLTVLTFFALPISLDPGVWYFGRSLFGLAMIAGLAIFGFVRTLGAHALFGEPVLED